MVSNPRSRKVFVMQTAEELLNWALDNIHSTNWRLILIMKTYEDRLKKLTPEQVEGIDIFLSLVQKDKFYMGTDDSYVRIKDMLEVFNKIKELCK